MRTQEKEERVEGEGPKDGRKNKARGVADRFAFQSCDEDLCPPMPVSI